MLLLLYKNMLVSIMEIPIVPLEYNTRKCFRVELWIRLEDYLLKTRGSWYFIISIWKTQGQFSCVLWNGGKKRVEFTDRVAKEAVTTLHPYSFTIWDLCNVNAQLSTREVQSLRPR